MSAAAITQPCQGYANRFAGQLLDKPLVRDALANAPAKRARHTSRIIAHGIAHSFM